MNENNPNLPARSMDLAKQFLGASAPATRGGGFPRGLNAANMVDYGRSPAGQQLLNRIKRPAGERV